MGAIGFQTHSILRLRNLTSIIADNPKLGKQIFFSGDLQFSIEEKEIRLGVSCLAARSDGTRRRGRSPLRRGSRRSSKKEGDEDDNDDEISSRVEKKPDPAGQEEIIALFRRIQSSISNDDSTRHDLTDSSNVSDEKSPAASILKVLHGSGKKQEKGKTDEERNRLLSRKRSVPKKEQTLQDYQPPVREFKLTRPPSNFVRRSPIPSPTILRVSLALDDDISVVTGVDELQLPKVERMKLAELKELAKSRGIKGYSKLNKKELIDLLLRS